jgi:hypothetical protein
MTVPMVKMSPCCARVHARLTMDEANLGRLAKQAAIRVEKGLSIVKLTEAIERAKADVAAARVAIDEHDANHAGGGL